MKHKEGFEGKHKYFIFIQNLFSAKNFNFQLTCFENKVK